MTRINKKTNLIFSVLTAVLITVAVANSTAAKAYADCTPNYGGGETCTYNKQFTIEKWVKLEGDNTWKDEVVVDLNKSDEKDKDVLFKIKVTASVSDAAGVDVSQIEFDQMKMKDRLPDELKFLDDASQDSLTEEWDNFKPGESKTFYFSTKIRDSEKNKEGDFEKCVVNKASLYFKDDFQDSDDATVCYKKSGEVLGTHTELPKTGATPVTGILGLGILAFGVVLKAKKSPIA